MKIKAKVDSLSEVPEAFRGLYTEQSDGSYAITEVEGMETPESVQGLKNARDRERDERKQAKSELKEIRDALDALGVSEVSELQEVVEKGRNAENSKMVDEGKFEEALNKRMAEAQRQNEAKVRSLEAALEEAQTSATQAQSKMRDMTIDGSIKDAAMAAGVREEALPYLSRAARETFDLDDNGRLVAKDGDGEILYGRDGRNPLSVDEWLGSKRESESFLFRPNTGGGASGSGQRKDGKRVVERNSDNWIGDNLEALASGEATPGG